MNEKGMDTRIFKLLAYLPFLWMIGYLCSYRNDKDVRFHVGQGMILNIAGILVIIAVELFIYLVVKSIFSVEQVIFGVKTGIFVVTTVGTYIILGLRILTIGVYAFYVVMGILNVINKRENKLPFVGEYSFLR